MAQTPRAGATDSERSMSRRSFLGIAAGSAMAAPWIGRLARAAVEDKRFDPSFGTATQATRAIRTGVISSRELVQNTFRRIKKYNPTINAFITLIEEPAMRRGARRTTIWPGGKPGAVCMACRSWSRTRSPRPA